MGLANSAAITLGILISVIGWAMLIFFPGLGIEIGSRSIVNIHMLTISEGVINFGYFVAFMGLLNVGFLHVTAAITRLQPSVPSPAKPDGEGMPAA